MSTSVMSTVPVRTTRVEGTKRKALVAFTVIRWTWAAAVLGTRAHAPAPTAEAATVASNSVARPNLDLLGGDAVAVICVLRRAAAQRFSTARRREPATRLASLA